MARTASKKGKGSGKKSYSVLEANDAGDGQEDSDLPKDEAGRRKIKRQYETLLGIQTRYDGISDSVSNTYQRQFLFNTLVDKIREGNVGIYAQNTMHWTNWFKTTAGWRGDAFATSVEVRPLLRVTLEGKERQ